jgi:hypothetical protein
VHKGSAKRQRAQVGWTIGQHGCLVQPQQLDCQLLSVLAAKISGAVSRGPIEAGAVLTTTTAAAMTARVEVKKKGAATQGG